MQQQTQLFMKDPLYGKQIQDGMSEEEGWLGIQVTGASAGSTEGVEGMGEYET